MNKFTSQDLSAIKTGKTEFKKLVNQIAKNSIFKSPTISFFNKKGNLAVIKSLDYQLQDLSNLIKAYRFEYKELLNKYADNEFSARPTLSARGWHKDHNNYNKAESWERTPAKRKTPARNVKKK